MPEAAIAAPAAASVAGDAGGSSPSIAPSPSAVEAPLSSAPPAGADPAQPDAAQEPGADAEHADVNATPEEKQDARLLPKHIRELKTTNPEAFKAEKQRFYEHRSYRETFPTVAEARRAKQSLEIVGGEPGLQALQTDIADFRQVAGQFAEGKPEFSKDLFENDPIAAASHVPHFLDNFMGADRDGYNREMAKRFATEFQAVKLRPHLEAAYNSLPQGAEGDKAREILNNIAGWHDSISKVAKSEENPQVVKLKNQLKAERESKAKESSEKFFKSYEGDALKAINSEASRQLDSWMKGRNLDPEVRTDFLKELIEKADGIATKDQGFARDRDQLRSRGDKDAAVRFVTARYTEALTDAMKLMARKYGSVAGNGNAATAQKSGNTPPNRPAAPAGFVAVNARPNPNEIDKSPGKTTFRMISVEKKAFMKDGRKITWAHLS